MIKDGSVGMGMGVGVSVGVSVGVGGVIGDAKFGVLSETDTTGYGGWRSVRWGGPLFDE